MSGTVEGVTNEAGHLTLVAKTERIDAAAAREFKTGALELLDGSPHSVSLDLAQVDFIDSSGIGALLSIQKKLAPSGIGLKLVRVKPQVQSVIELLRLHKVFEIEG